MENYFNNINKDVLSQVIVRAVREQAAKTLRENADGCIEVLYVPLTCEADEWLGGQSVSDSDSIIMDVTEYGVTHKLMPLGTHTLEYKDECGNVGSINCFGFVHMKIAYMARKLKLHKRGRLDMIRADVKSSYNWEKNGFTLSAGAIALTLQHVNPENHYKKELLRIWIGVSGADKSRLDRAWALAGARSAIKYCRSCEEKTSKREYRFSFFK